MAKKQGGLGKGLGALFIESGIDEAKGMRFPPLKSVLSEYPI